MTKHWHRLPRGVVESPSMEIFKSCMGTVLGDWLWVALPEQGRLDEKTSRGPTSTPT